MAVLQVSLLSIVLIIVSSMLLTECQPKKSDETVQRIVNSDDVSEKLVNRMDDMEKRMMNFLGNAKEHSDDLVNRMEDSEKRMMNFLGNAVDKIMLRISNVEEKLEARGDIMSGLREQFLSKTLA